jgi:hypothetical protein
MRFSEKETLKITQEDGSTLPKFEIRLITETQDNSWPMSTWGVLGLSPKGTFFKYLSTLYDETPAISLALKYETKNKKASEDELTFTLSPFLNPIPAKHYQEEDILGKFTQDKSSESWYLKGSVSLPGTEFNYPTQKICLDTYTEEWFGIIEGEIWCQRVRQAVCNSPKSKDCKKEKADLSLAPKIELTIEAIDLSIPAEDYVYFNKDGLQCRIGDPCTARDEEACPKETQIVLGKMFMEKYVPILEVDRESGVNSITLVKSFKAPKSKKMIWVIVGIVVVVIAVIGIIYMITKRKQASDESHYVKY